MELLAALLLAFSVAASAQVMGTDRFGGMDDTDAPATLDPAQAQDLLNTESNVTGTAILKRKGFSLEATLTYSTSPVNGSHYLVDSSGNNVTLVCHDRYCSKSTNNSAFTNVFTSTSASVTRWSFVDINGKVYGGNDQRDPVLQYDPTSGVSNPAGMPAGSVLELCRDRLVITDVAAAPNRVYYSQSGVYTNYTTNINSADPWTDDIGTPGNRNTALKCDRGRLFIFKSNSIVSCVLADQFSTLCAPVSNSVGTLDPASVVSAPDGIYFRSQDRAYWRIDDSGLTLISQKISNFVKSQTTGSSQSNTQTTQTDWMAGAQFPGGSWDTGTIAGSVFPSSSSRVDTSTADFATGTFALSSMTMTSNGEIVPALFLNSGFENSPAGDGAGVNPAGWTGSMGTTLTIFGHSVCGANSTGNFTWGGTNAVNAVACSGANPSIAINIVNAATGAVLYVATHTFTTTTGCARQSIDVSTQNVYMAITVQSGARTLTSTSFSTAAVPGGIIEYGAAGVLPITDIGNTGITCFSGPQNGALIDFAQPYGTSKSTFTSTVYDTGFSTPTWGTFKSTITTTGAEASVAYSLLVGNSASGTFDAAVSMASDGRPNGAAQKRFFKYQAVFSTSKSSVTASIKDVELNYATTGLYQTQCFTPGSGITSWGLLSCDATTAGGGSVVFYATSSYSCAQASTQTVINWPSVTNNATLSGVSVSSAVIIGWRSLLTSSTDQAQVNACTLYWNNGAAAPPAWGLFDSIKNAIYWTASVNNSTTNNRLLKLDLNLGQWYPFDIGAAAPKFISGAVYFGDSAAGKWYKYGSVDADNGAAINAYWKSKDFSLASPFQETSWSAASVVARNQVTGSMTGTWTQSNSQSGSWTISLSTNSALTYVRSSYYLPRSSPSNFINLKLSNNAANQPFEILGLRLDGVSLPWRPNGP